MSQFGTLSRWWKAMGSPSSMLNALRLLKTGRLGGDANLSAARMLRARTLPFPIYARPATDDLLDFLEIFVESEYEYARQIREPIRTVLDLGTNIGCSIAYLSAVFPEAKFVGIEPSPQNFAMAQRTLASLVKENRVSLHHGFIGARQRQAVLARGGDGGSNEIFLSDEPANEISTQVPVITIPQLLAEHNVQQIDLLKCDIEGGENELFSQCAEWIDRVRWIVIELHNHLMPDWVIEQARAGGARFKEVLFRQKNTGISLAWLKRQDDLQA